MTQPCRDPIEEPLRRRATRWGPEPTPPDHVDVAKAAMPARGKGHLEVTPSYQRLRRGRPQPRVARYTALRA